MRKPGPRDTLVQPGLTRSLAEEAAADTAAMLVGLDVQEFFGAFAAQVPLPQGKTAEWSGRRVRHSWGVYIGPHDDVTLEQARDAALRLAQSGLIARFGKE